MCDDVIPEALPFFDVKEAQVGAETRWIGKVMVERVRPFIILEVESQLMAMPARCPHEGVSLLHAPLVAADTIECLEHNNRYSLKNGPLRAYRVERRDDAFFLLVE